jgi:hypothetical protein
LEVIKSYQAHQAHSKGEKNHPPASSAASLQSVYLENQAISPSLLALVYAPKVLYRNAKGVVSQSPGLRTRNPGEYGRSEINPEGVGSTCAIGDDATPSG